MISTLPHDVAGDARVRSAFDRAARTYDAAAEFQRIICDRLIDSLRAGVVVQQIADLGCGTGYASSRLAGRFPGARICAIDFAPAMLTLARRQGKADHWIAADLQRLPLADRSMDLLCSSLALQWCEPSAVFREAARVLRPGGWLALATVGPGTLAELADAFAGIDGNDHVLRFLPLGSLVAALESAGLCVENATDEPLTLFRPNLRAILRELRDIGANNAGPRRRRAVLGRTAWHRIEQRYETLRVQAGLPVTYRALHLIARRR